MDYDIVEFLLSRKGLFAFGPEETEGSGLGCARVVVKHGGSGLVPLSFEIQVSQLVSFENHIVVDLGLQLGVC